MSPKHLQKLHVCPLKTPAHCYSEALTTAVACVEAECVFTVRPELTGSSLKKMSSGWPHTVYSYETSLALRHCHSVKREKWNSDRLPLCALCCSCHVYWTQATREESACQQKSSIKGLVVSCTFGIEVSVCIKAGWRGLLLLTGGMSPEKLSQQHEVRTACILIQIPVPSNINSRWQQLLSSNILCFVHASRALKGSILAANH